VQEVQALYGIPVVAIATLDDLMSFLAGRAELRDAAARVAAYRERYGARNIRAAGGA
jgi:orotate phosphoribosyltransferase